MSNPFAADPSAVRGAITPLVTPFAADGSLDLEAIKPLVDWQLEQGTHGISVGGSTGEPTSQTVSERIAAMHAAAEAIDGRVPFLPATGTALMAETLELTAQAQRLGAAAALVVTPYYGRAQQEGLFRLVLGDRVRVPRPTHHRLQRAGPSSGRHRAGDRGPATPRARKHRRHQGDHPRLPACLPRPGRGR